MLENLSKRPELTDGTVVWTTRQTAGRGQIGNSWEAEPEKNISFSVLLEPRFIHPREQFVLSELTALAVAETLAALLADCSSEAVTIKWPNDIYVGDEKICGILIEHQLQGSVLSHSVLGIGINVNQERWAGNAPNPTSLKLKGADTTPEAVLNRVVSAIEGYYKALRVNTEVAKADLHTKFEQMLYRRNGFFPYVDAATNEPFEATFSGVEPTGQIHLQDKSGHERVYWFKEIKFVLPCGTIKE